MAGNDRSPDGAKAMQSRALAQSGLDQSNQPSPARRRSWSWLRRLLLIGSVSLAVLLGAAILFHPEAQRDATRAFGRLANMVRNRPNRVAAVCVVSLAALWTGIATLAAGQEAHRRLFRN